MAKGHIPVSLLEEHRMKELRSSLRLTDHECWCWAADMLGHHGISYVSAALILQVVSDNLR